MSIWRRKPVTPERPPPVSPERAEAIAARVESEVVAARVRGDSAKVRALADLLREHREENGFGALLSQTLRDVR